MHLSKLSPVRVYTGISRGFDLEIWPRVGHLTKVGLTDPV